MKIERVHLNHVCCHSLGMGEKITIKIEMHKDTSMFG